MIAVPLPISRAYNSAPPTGMRLSCGAARRSFSSGAVEAQDNHAAYAQTSTASANVVFDSGISEPVSLIAGFQQKVMFLGHAELRFAGESKQLSKRFARMNKEVRTVQI